MNNGNDTNNAHKRHQENGGAGGGRTTKKARGGRGGRGRGGGGGGRGGGGRGNRNRNSNNNNNGNRSNDTNDNSDRMQVDTNGSTAPVASSTTTTATSSTTAISGPTHTSTETRNRNQFSEAKFVDQPSISPLSKRALTEVLQYEFMTKVQEATLPTILKGVDIVAKAKTGRYGFPIFCHFRYYLCIWLERVYCYHYYLSLFLNHYLFSLIAVEKRQPFCCPLSNAWLWKTPKLTVTISLRLWCSVQRENWPIKLLPNFKNWPHFIRK